MQEAGKRPKDVPYNLGTHNKTEVVDGCIRQILLSQPSDSELKRSASEEDDYSPPIWDDITKPAAFFAQDADGHFVFTEEHKATDTAHVDMFVFLTELDKATSHEGSGDGIKARENIIDPQIDIHKSTAMVDYLHELTDAPEIDLKLPSEDHIELPYPAVAQNKVTRTISSMSQTKDRYATLRHAKHTLNIFCKRSKSRNFSLPTVGSTSLDGIDQKLTEDSAPTSPKTPTGKREQLYDSVKSRMRRPSLINSPKPSTARDLCHSVSRGIRRPSLMGGDRHHEKKTDISADDEHSMVQAEGILIRVHDLNGTEMVIGATPEILVQRVSGCNVNDIELTYVLILTFRHIMTPVQLLALMIKRFQSEENIASEDVFPTQIRVVNFVIKWMAESWFDFHECAEMETLIQKLIELISELNMDLAQKLTTVKAEQEATWKQMEATHAAIPPKLTDITTLGLIDIPAPILARQLIRIDSQLFQKVRRQEVLVHLWCPKHKHAKTFSYNLNKYISWFNKVGLLVSSAICECVDIKDRIALIEHFINVAKVLRKHNCYNTLYGITSGLNHGAVNRLKHTWRMVSNRAQANLRDFEVLLSPAQNFRVYRQELRESRVPSIPVMGIVLKDHTFLNEMPKQTSDGLVNLFKLRAIKSHLDTMEVYQRGAIQYAFDDDLPFQKQLMETTVCTPDELYEKSQILEPRELRSEARSSGTS